MCYLATEPLFYCVIKSSSKKCFIPLQPSVAHNVMHYIQRSIVHRWEYLFICLHIHKCLILTTNRLSYLSFSNRIPFKLRHKSIKNKTCHLTLTKCRTKVFINFDWMSHRKNMAPNEILKWLNIKCLLKMD